MADAYTRRGWSQGAPGWVRHEALFDAVFAPVTAAILTAAELGSGQRVLDVGCGSGTLLEAAGAAGADPVGVDISADMVEAARQRVPRATVIQGDAQTLGLLAAAPGARFDRVISRFGVMFFEDPAAAFANLRRVAAPQARMTFACWRGLAENPTFTLGTEVLTGRLESPPPPIPGRPGPGRLRRCRAPACPSGPGRLGRHRHRSARRRQRLRDRRQRRRGGAARHAAGHDHRQTRP